VIAGFKLDNGESLLSAAKLDHRSYVSWICAIRNQNEADFVLTNEFILYDLASEPYPHSIFQKCKMGGASLLSPKRRAIHRRALVASTFSMVTDIPFFIEEGAEWLTTRERLEVIGTFIVAHEMGHAVFKIPDFYDHPPECLMTTKFETGYVSGWRELKAHPGPCPDCQPYVDAKRHVFLAHEARMDGKLDEVIKNLKIAIRKTPKHTDGSYLRYVADLSVQIAETFAAKGDPKQARRWLKAALRIVPEHDQALALAASLK
jgi:tetratricopeptide (TPR) repeat protein